MVALHSCCLLLAHTDRCRYSWCSQLFPGMALVLCLHVRLKFFRPLDARIHWMVDWPVVSLATQSKEAVPAASIATVLAGSQQCLPRNLSCSGRNLQIRMLGPAVPNRVPSACLQPQMTAADACRCMQVLPEAYGGSAQLVPVEHAVALQRRRSRVLASKAPTKAGAPDGGKGRLTAAGR